MSLRQSLQLPWSFKTHLLLSKAVHSHDLMIELGPEADHNGHSQWFAVGTFVILASRCPVRPHLLVKRKVRSHHLGVELGQKRIAMGYDCKDLALELRHAGGPLRFQASRSAVKGTRSHQLTVEPGARGRITMGSCASLHVGNSSSWCRVHPQRAVN